MLNLLAYLERIGYSGSTEPSAETLRALHRAHMFAVPFENLDIHLGRPIVCDEARFLHKIVNERRGGFCYELNGAFAALLRALGFQVTLLSARVTGADGGTDGPDFDHLTLRVDLPNPVAHGLTSEVPWLADVGFGDGFVEPLRLAPNLEQSQIGRVYRLTERSVEGEVRFDLEVRTDDKWKGQYSFTLQPRQLPDFAVMCRYQQTSPESHFTRQRICSRATPWGRITLSDFKLIESRDGRREERELGGEQQWRASLRELFGIDLPG
jgi:N-hydroxyarylamine O-acetyltransferase